MSTANQEQPWYGRALIGLVVLLLAVSVIVKWRFATVPAAGMDAPVAEFSAARAVRQLAHVLGDQQPHPVDSAAADGVRSRIVETLRGLAYTVEVQDTTSCRTVGVPSCARVRNIIAVREGRESGKAVLLSAHYDSVAAGPGASDAGSAVGTLLEIARLLQQRPQGRNAVILLFNEGEESGLLGAHAFMSSHPRAKNVALAINIEARGSSGQSVMFETGNNSGWIVEQFASTSKRPLTNSLLYEVYKLMPNDTDFTVYKASGVEGLNFAHGEKLPYYHTPNDSLEHLDLGSVQQHGDNVDGLVAALAEVNLAAQPPKGGRVYTDILGLGMVHWQIAWGMAIALALIVCFAAAVLVLKKRQAFAWRSVLLGALSVPLLVIAACAAVYLLTFVFSLLSGGAAPWRSDALGNRVLLWAVVLLTTVSLQRLMSRNTQALGFWIGICVPWLLLTLASSLALPGASYLFVLPMTVAVVALAVLVLVRQPHLARAALVMVALSALAAAIVFVPSVYLLEAMIGFAVPTGILGMSVLIALALSLIGPLTVRSSSRATPMRLGMAAAAIVVIGAFMALRAPARASDEPAVLNLSYVQQPAGAAHLLVGTTHQQPASTVLAAVGAPLAPLQAFPWSPLQYRAAARPSVQLPSATLVALGETAAAASRREVHARIQAGPGLQTALVLFPAAAGLQSVRVDGHSLDYTGDKGSVSGFKAFVCHGESCDGKELTLVFAAGGARQATVVRVTGGLPASMAGVAAARDAVAVPQGGGDQSYVVSQVAL